MNKTKRMDVVFVPVKWEGKFDLGKIKIKDLPKKICVVSSVQHLDDAKKIIDYLKGKGKVVFYGGQVIGCNVSNALKYKNKVGCFLFVGSGRFHVIEISRRTKKDVFIFNPISNQFYRFDKSEIDKLEKKNKAMVSKFLMSKNIGILVSTKVGQENMKLALRLGKMFKNDKNIYLFLFDTLRENDLLNFPFIDVWINTACPRISEDFKNMISANDLLNYLSKFKGD